MPYVVSEWEEKIKSDGSVVRIRLYQGIPPPHIELPPIGGVITTYCEYGGKKIQKDVLTG